MDKRNLQTPYGAESKEIDVNDPGEIMRILLDLMRRQVPLSGVGNRSKEELLAKIVGIEEVGRQMLLGRTGATSAATYQRDADRVACGGVHARGKAIPARAAAAVN